METSSCQPSFAHRATATHFASGLRGIQRGASAYSLLHSDYYSQLYPIVLVKWNGGKNAGASWCGVHHRTLRFHVCGTYADTRIVQFYAG